MKIKSGHKLSGVMQFSLVEIAFKPDGILFLEFGDGRERILDVFNILLGEILD